jgi:hypothetical protein
VFVFFDFLKKNQKKQTHLSPKGLFILKLYQT